jgi:tellurium resistance protein TerD
MNDDNDNTPKTPDDISKYGYDPLDDIKPIDTDDYVKNKDDTFSAPILDEEELHQKKQKAAPRSALEDKPRREAKEFMVADEIREQVFKGDYVDILKRDPTLRQIMVGAGWEQKAFDRDPIDLDLSCFLLDKTDMTREDSDFVFYNNPVGCNGAVKLLDDSRTGGGDGDDEQIFIDLNGLPFEVIRLVFSISIYDQKLKGHHFGHMRDMFVRIFNYEDNNEVARFLIPDDELDGMTGTIAFVLVREGPQWFMQPLAEPYKGGLSPIAKKYGLIIAEESG